MNKKKSFKILIVSMAFIIFSSLVYAGVKEWKMSKQASGRIETIEELNRINVQFSNKVSMSESESPEKAQLSGKVMRKSDVATFPDVPFEGVIIIAIPADKLDLLIEEAGLPEDAKDNLRRFHPVLPQALFEKYVEAYTTSQQNGDYVLQVTPAVYLLCLANIGRSETLPVHVEGCIEVEVTGSEPVEQDIFWGLGGATPQ